MFNRTPPPRGYSQAEISDCVEDIKQLGRQRSEADTLARTGTPALRDSYAQEARGFTHAIAVLQERLEYMVDVSGSDKPGKKG